MAGARSADTTATKKSLSKNVLQMKFMVRGKEHGETVSPSLNSKRDESHWFVGGKEESAKKLPYSFDASYVECEELLPYGRMSFLKFNPVVENKHQEILRKAKCKISGAREEFDGISDDEMANRYETLVGTMAKKYKTNRKRKSRDSSSDTSSDEDTLEKRAKRGFIKPKDDDEDDFQF